MNDAPINRNPRDTEDHRRNWRRLGSPVHSQIPVGAIDGTNDTFTLPGLGPGEKPKQGSLSIWLGASATTLNRIAPTAYTTSIDGTSKVFTIVFTTPPATGSVILADYWV